MVAASFDYVIVGAGSAGCVLAHRLSADPARTVCLVEAGPPDRNPLIHVPAAVVALYDHPRLNWRFATVPQPRLAGRALPVPRGRVLGGTSSINGMIYARGHPGDYDEWAAMGNPGWSFAEVLPYFRKSEDNLSFGATEFHGAGGPLTVSDLPRRNPLVDVFFSATDSLGLPRTADYNAGDNAGFGTRQVNIRDGRRVSTATAFLSPIRDRRNLTVITGALVDRVTLSGRRATGIEYAHTGQRRRIEARRAVVLAAGAIASPLILMRSGVGDPAELARHGIAVKHALPGVGRNLQDHLAADVSWSSPSAVPYGLSWRTLPRHALSALQYLVCRRGFFASNFMEASGFLRSDPALPRPDMQFVFIPGYRDPGGRLFRFGHGFALTAVLLRPKSRGSVALSGADPTAAPVIDPCFFSVEDDCEALLLAYQVARRILAAPAFDPYRGAELLPGSDRQSDDQLRQFLREFAHTIFHPVGSCRMGTDPMAVVDPKLRVHGIDGLRVADASIMPTIVGGNTNAPVIMIGEKAADLMLKREHEPDLPR